MTEGERRSFNLALDRVQAFEWRDRVLRLLDRKLEVLGPSDKIALLRKIEELL